MRLFFSEWTANYARHAFPYQVWAFREEGESVAALLARGFLPGSTDLSRFYLARSIRVDGALYSANARTRHIHKRAAGLQLSLVPRPELVPDSWLRVCSQYAAWRYPNGGMSAERIMAILAGNWTTDYGLCHDENGRIVALVSLYLGSEEASWYGFAYYLPEMRQRQIGVYMMLEVAETLLRKGCRYLYLGTTYHPDGRYKSRLPGIAFFNGCSWSTDREELRFLYQRDCTATAQHLLETPAYLQEFGGPARVAAGLVIELE